MLGPGEVEGEEVSGGESPRLVCWHGSWVGGGERFQASTHAKSLGS